MVQVLMRTRDTPTYPVPRTEFPFLLYNSLIDKLQLLDPFLELKIVYEVSRAGRLVSLVVLCFFNLRRVVSASCGLGTCELLEKRWGVGCERFIQCFVWVMKVFLDLSHFLQNPALIQASSLVLVRLLSLRCPSWLSFERLKLTFKGLGYRLCW
jgi:hypothetical protein